MADEDAEWVERDDRTRTIEVAMYGANADELEALAQRCRVGSQMFSRAASTLTRQLETSPWQGPNAQQFRAEWGRSHRHALLSAAARLEQAADALRRNADEQRAASAAGNPIAGTPDPQREGGTTSIKGFRGKWKWEPSTDPLYRRGDGDLSEIDPGDVVQGELGDCFVLATLKSMARADPGLIRRMITDNGDGTYTVHMFDEKRNPIDVTVEATFPTRVNPFWFDDKLRTASSADGELWVKIIEKAYLQRFHEGYGGVKDGGYRLNALIHMTGEPVYFSKGAELTNENFQTLADGIASGEIVATAGTFKKEEIPDKSIYNDHDLINTHAYSIEKVDMDARLVYLDNPHGSNDAVLTFDEFKSAFHDATWVEVEQPPKIDMIQTAPRFA